MTGGGVAWIVVGSNEHEGGSAMRRPDGGGPMSHQHAGLLRRVTTLLRPAVEPASREAAEAPSPDEPGLEALRERVGRLETMVEGLQDALYRQAVRQDERIEELRARLEPDVIARSLSDDARRRGL
jgi:hypothetical protein